MKIVACIVALVMLCGNANAQDFESFLEIEKNERAGHPSWNKMIGGELCEALTAVGRGCSYAERYALLDFLYDHDVVIFRCTDGMNPYIAGHCDDYDRYDDRYVYIGSGAQNAFFAKSVISNKELFHDGNLTPERARLWK